jgi:hypothetical protein
MADEIAIDWTRPTSHRWKFDFELVPPNRLGDSYGYLDNVDPSSVTITEGYYTDTRVQAKLTYYGENPHRQAYIRIIATDTVSGYPEELGTFIPTSDDVTMEGSIVKTTLSLESVLYGISMQKLQREWVCSTGTYAYTNLVNILVKKCGMSLDGSNFRFAVNKHGRDVGSNDVKFDQDALKGAGSSILELMYGICNATNNRLDVDGHGRVLWYKYIAPSERVSTFTITLNSPDSIVLDGVTRSSNYLEMASQVTVHATKAGTGDAEDEEITQTVTATGRLGLDQRGYIVGKYYDVSELDPFTWQKANTLAQEHLKASQNENMEWQLTMEYMPIYTGDVGYLEGLQDAYSGYSGRQKVFVKSREIDLATMTQKLTLKAASSNDTDTGEEE